MPGFEWINKLEEQAVKKVFLEGYQKRMCHPTERLLL